MAQIIVKNFNQLWQAMDSVLAKAINYDSYVAEDIIRQFISVWYGDYDPKRHEREFQLFRALFRTNSAIMPDNTVKAWVYIDTSMMKHTFHDEAHQLTEEDILLAANEGLHGALGGTVVAGRQGIKIWDDAIDYIEYSKVLITEFVKYLRSQGYDVKVK